MWLVPRKALKQDDIEEYLVNEEDIEKFDEAAKKAKKTVEKYIEELQV